MGADVLKGMRSNSLFWKLMLAAMLVVSCKSKRELPEVAKKIVDNQANVMINVGNGAAFGRILQRFGGGPAGPR
jgi:H+/gluconate symporter-like permease